MSEPKWTKQIVGEMVARGCVVVVLSASLRQQAGVPDRWAVGPQVCSFTCWLEFKAARGKLRADQKLLIGAIRARCPHAAYVVREPDVEAGWESGTVEDHEGIVLAEFSDGQSLMEVLCTLQKSVE